jgi:hypothetical protein
LRKTNVADHVSSVFEHCKRQGAHGNCDGEIRSTDASPDARRRDAEAPVSGNTITPERARKSRGTGI